MADSLSRRQQYLARHAGMCAERQPWEAHWRDVNDFLRPGRLRLYSNAGTEQSKRGQKNMQFIVNSHGTFALRSASAGMHTGVTNPSRPWFRLRTPYPQLNELAPVKDYLYTVETRMREVFQRSNVYATLPKMYADLLAFATSCALVEEDDRSVIRLYSLQPGTFWLAQSQRLEVDTVYRQFAMTVRQIVREFGGPNGDPVAPGALPDLTRFTDATRQAYNQGRYETPVDVLMTIEPNADYAPGDGPRLRTKMAWRVCYSEMNRPQDAADVLREGGYEEFPGLCPRWEVEGESVYGGPCPGTEALPDVKQLQQMEKRKLEIIDKQARPPMKAPTSMRNKPYNLLPGGVTFVDGNAGSTQFEAAMVVDPKIEHLLGDIAKKEQVIDHALFVDLFLAISSMGPDPQRNITATEINERREEKLLMLGPVLERLAGELLDPLIDRTYAIMNRRGLLPDPPAELQGQELRVEYISMLFQAQRMVATSGIERVAAFVSQLATVHPEAMDILDTDQAVQEYGDMLGLPPHVVRADDEVQQIRDARAKQQQLMQAAAAAKPVAEAAKAASETPMGGNNALTTALAGMGAPSP